MLHKLKIVLRLWKELGEATVNWKQEDTTATKLFFESASGNRFITCLRNAATRKDISAVFKGGGLFESGKAVGFREALVFIEWLSSSEIEDFNEDSEHEGVSDLLEKLRP
jgi:hypothetical protein